MNLGLGIISSNLGFALGDLIFLILIIGLIIFFALDFKIGMFVTFIFNALLFMWFYYLSWDYKKPLIVSLISIVLLSLSIFFMDKSQKVTGGFI
jgi:hypothetical protein